MSSSVGTDHLDKGDLLRTVLRFPVRNVHAGESRSCSRCGIACVVATDHNAAARLLPFADGPGVCATCAWRCWVQHLFELIGPYLPQGAERGCWRLPHVQENVGSLLRAGGADVDQHAVDFERLVVEWDLPLPKAKRSRKAS